MYKLLFFIISAKSVQVLAQNIKREHSPDGTGVQSIVQDKIASTMTQNVTGQTKSRLIREIKPLDEKEQKSDIDLNWQSLLKDLDGEPIAHELVGRRINKTEASQPEVVNNKEKPMLKDKPSALNVTTVDIDTSKGSSLPLVKNMTEKPLVPNITELPQHPNKPHAQNVLLQKNINYKKYQNVTDSARYLVPTPDYEAIHSPHLNPYQDTSYKNSMPPIQTQEQWNATNWRETEGLSDVDEVRQEEEYKQREKRYKQLHEEIMNKTTSCEEFLNNTVFDLEKVLDKDWHTIFYWNVRDEDPYDMKFSRPSETMIKRFKDELDKEIRPPVDWSAAELFVETNVDYSALYVKTNVSGLYRAIPSAAFQYFGIPIINYALKIVDDEYLGIANCMAKQCYALCDMAKLPQVEQIPLIAGRMGFYSAINNSFVRISTFEDDSQEDELDDNDLDEYDNLNTDPLKLDIF